MATSGYLADVRYNYAGVLANDYLPLGVAYMKEVMNRDMIGDVNSSLFVYPDRPLDALRATPPDALMLSDYVWNESLSPHFAKLAKQLRPEMLVVMGGPNIVLEPERQIAYLRGQPNLDIVVLGEGDCLAGPPLLSSGRAGVHFARANFPGCHSTASA